MQTSPFCKRAPIFVGLFCKGDLYFREPTKRCHSIAVTANNTHTCVCVSLSPTFCRVATISRLLKKFMSRLQKSPAKETYIFCKRVRYVSGVYSSLPRHISMYIYLYIFRYHMCLAPPPPEGYESSHTCE